jgi:hypothetical protein
MLGEEMVVLQAELKGMQTDKTLNRQAYSNLKAELNQAYERMDAMFTPLFEISQLDIINKGWFHPDGTAKRGLK